MLVPLMGTRVPFQYVLVRSIFVIPLDVGCSRVVQRLSSDIRITTTFRIEQPFVTKRADGVLDVRWHSLVLVFGTLEVVAEPAAGTVGWPARSLAEDCDFRIGLVRAAHACDVGTCAGVAGQECRCILAVVGNTIFIPADAIVAGSEEDCDASGTQLGELLAGFHGVVFGYCLLVVTVGRADDTREGIWQ